MMIVDNGAFYPTKQPRMLLKNIVNFTLAYYSIYEIQSSITCVEKVK